MFTFVSHPMYIWCAPGLPGTEDSVGQCCALAAPPSGSVTEVIVFPNDLELCISAIFVKTLSYDAW